MKNNTDLANYLACICDKDFSKNPLPWFYLHQVGLTYEILKSSCNNSDWHGPKPLFQNAPDRNGTFWKYLLDNKS